VFDAWSPPGRAPSPTTAPPPSVGRPVLSRPAAAVTAAVVAVAVAAGGAMLVSALWEQVGSGWRAARAQAELAEELTAVAPGADDPTFVSSGGLRLVDLAAADTHDPASTTGAPDAAPGDPVARIVIPSISVDQVVVWGVDVEDLKKGPGWMPGTAFPGEPGNAVLSGHRTTYGGPFRHLDRLRPGDRIVVSFPDRPDAVYEVRAVPFDVLPSGVFVAAPTPGARLTLTTCTPVGSAERRLVVQAELVEGTHAAAALPADTWGVSRP
jgi:sortase A